MGTSIHKRGRAYRLRFRYKDYDDFSITFYDLEKATEWGIKHQDEYLKDPDKYHSWVKQNRSSVKQNGIFHHSIEIEEPQ